MGRRVVWYIFTDLLSNVLPQSPSLNMFIPSQHRRISTGLKLVTSKTIFKSSVLITIPLCNLLTSDPISKEFQPFFT